LGYEDHLQDMYPCRGFLTTLSSRCLQHRKKPYNSLNEPISALDIFNLRDREQIDKWHPEQSGGHFLLKSFYWAQGLVE
jgi:hypothetical protein